MVRFKNKALWLAIAALGLLIARALGYQVDEGQYNTLIEAILGVLILAGIINDPTTGEWFGDKEKE